MSAVSLIGLVIVALFALLFVVGTSFGKIQLILLLLRNALGLQEVPPNFVLAGFALLLTTYTMLPVLPKLATPVAQLTDMMSASSERITLGQGFAVLRSCCVSLQPFFEANSSKKNRMFFAKIMRDRAPDSLRNEKDSNSDLLLGVTLSAFVLTELEEGFAIGFLLFLPFALVDLLVGATLASLSLQNTTPTVFSIPLKLLLFVSTKGWQLLSEALIYGYQ